MQAAARILCQAIVVCSLSTLPLTSALANTAYKIVNVQGAVSFSDTLSPGAKELNLTPVAVAPPANMTTNTLASEPEQKIAISYQKLSILAPLNDETIWDNNGNFTVHVDIQPSLQPGDNLQLIVDGKIVAQSANDINFNITGIDRGTHILQTQVINSNARQPIKVSDSVTVYVHKTSVQK